MIRAFNNESNRGRNDGDLRGSGACRFAINVHNVREGGRLADIYVQISCPDEASTCVNAAIRLPFRSNNLSARETIRRFGLAKGR